MDIMQGKHFSITDPEGISTVIYQINKTEKEFQNQKNLPKYTVERLEYTEEFYGQMKKKTFFVEEPEKNSQIVILSFGKDKVVINNGILEDDKVRISKKPMPYKFNTIFSEKGQELRDVNYTPNLKRPITIIDPETTEEVKPVLYFDEETKDVKGKCKLKPNKPYFVFEIREENNKLNLLGGSPTMTD